MKLVFTKMHGLGNDFVVFDGIRQTVDLTVNQLKSIANRHFGIGCDQVLLIQAAVTDNADFRYRIFNADGEEVSQCGNGARCLARFVQDKGLSSNRQIAVETNSGLLHLAIESDDQITVDMGVPRHTPAEIPLIAEKESLSYNVTINDKTWYFGATSLGNPHAVIIVDDVSKAPVKEIGQQLERHPIFPKRANIGFMEVVDRHHIRLRVFERGSGETLACGSGACAASIVGYEQGLIGYPLKVSLSGGDLSVKWQGRGDPIYLGGPAVSVFEGTIEL